MAVKATYNNIRVLAIKIRCFVKQKRLIRWFVYRSDCAGSDIHCKDFYGIFRVTSHRGNSSCSNTSLIPGICGFKCAVKRCVFLTQRISHFVVSQSWNSILLSEKPSMLIHVTVRADLVSRFCVPRGQVFVIVGGAKKGCLLRLCDKPVLSTIMVKGLVS